MYYRKVYVKERYCKCKQRMRRMKVNPLDTKVTSRSYVTWRSHENRAGWRTVTRRFLDL